MKITVAVTGHRDVVVTQTLLDAIDTFFDALYSQYSEVRLLSPLAEGADSVVAEVFLSHQKEKASCRLEVPLPMEETSYINLWPDISKKRYQRLSADAQKVYVIPKVLEDPYENLGHYLVAQAQILLALWDGKENHKAGGTAEVVNYAKSQNLPTTIFSCTRQDN
jgi:hypothetical protein